MALFNKRANVKKVSDLSPGQYRAEVRALRRIVPDMTEKQARDAIASRRRNGYVLDNKASAVEKSRFRDEFGKRSIASNLGKLTKITSHRMVQNEYRHGDNESQISAEGRQFRRIARDTEKLMSSSQRLKLRQLESAYWEEYKEAMGYK